MNRLSTTFALLALTAAGAAAAQTMQGQSQPPAGQIPPPASTAPSDQSPNSMSQDQGANSTSGTTDKKTQMKECIKQERANNSGMSHKDARKACKQQLSSSPQS